MSIVTEEPEESEESLALRANVREWLAQNWDPDRPEAEWMDAVVDAGYACPTWPAEWFGLGLSRELGTVVSEEFVAAGAPGGGQDALHLAGNTVLSFGGDQLKALALRPLLTGRMRTCLLYSEPGAGSDLAAVQTFAERRGEEWVVNGQKVWTSGAKEADYGLLIARTDWDVPKHRGMTYFFFPMKQPGVDVRPIKQCTGSAHFNEVFFTDAQVPDANVIGNVNEGWRVLQTALAYERLLMGRSRGASTTPPGAPRQGRGSSGDREQGELNTLEGGADFVDLARQTGKDADPVYRQAIMRLYTSRKENAWNNTRARANMARGSSSPLASMGKLAMSPILHGSARLNSFLLGPEAMLNPPDDSSTAHAVNEASLTAYVNSIGGGSDQIQRNILGERVLGLPKEPEVDRTVPFREVKKAVGLMRFS